MGLFLVEKRVKELGEVGGGQRCRPSPDTCVATRQTPERFLKTFLPVAYASSLRSKAEPWNEWKILSLWERRRLRSKQTPERAGAGKVLATSPTINSATYTNDAAK
ncbi:hypothetical protein CKO51_06280 [Rhodopirellula sp. SM50]|nr:hypothetical protein CKO51_06280 [Rhodopirellula sp. SM50]